MTADGRKWTPRGHSGLAAHCGSSPDFTKLWVTSYQATKRHTEKIPLESARAGAEDDSPVMDPVTDPGTNLTMSKDSISVEATSSNLTEKKPQLCVWLAEGYYSKGPENPSRENEVIGKGNTGKHIDSYFLRSALSQSVEVQRQEVTHSSQDISSPDVEVDSSTEAEREASQPDGEDEWS